MLIVLAALDEKRPGPVLTRDIERVLERSGEATVYGPNLRASCRRLEDAGWLRTLRAPDLRLAVAQPLLQAEQDRLREEGGNRRSAAGPGIRSVRRLHFCHRPAGGAGRHDVSGLPWGFCGASRRQHLSAVME